MRYFLLALCLAFSAGLAASGSEINVYATMDAKRLRGAVELLEAELAKIKSRLEVLEAMKPAAQGKAWLLDDFENEEAWKTPGGGGWWAGGDQHGMGTTVDPDPYQRQKGGCPDSPGYSGGIDGHLGPDEEPWTWASFGYNWHGEQGPEPKDLSAYRFLEFWVKGDGTDLKLALENDAVKDFDRFTTRVKTTKRWQKVRIALADFKQAGWGKVVADPLKAVRGISFSPTLHETDYQFRIDELKLAE